MKLFGIIFDNSLMDNFYFELPREIDINLNVLTRTIYTIVASWILGFWGECSKALEMSELALEANQELNNKYIELICIYNRISLLEEMGRLRESEAGYLELDEAIGPRYYKVCFGIFKNVGLPGVYIKKLMDKEAEELLIEGQNIVSDLSGRAAFNSLLNGIEYNLAEVKYIQGDIDECERLLDHFDKQNKGSYLYIQMLALRIRLLYSEGRVEKDEYIDFINIYEEMYRDSICSGIIRITYGIAIFEMGEYEDSLKIFNDVIFISRKNGSGYPLMYSLLWKVIVLCKLNSDNTRDCINSLKEAIFYSREEDILYPYYVNRKYLSEIINKYEKQLLSDKDNKDFLKKIYRAMDKYDENKVLSPREIEVLKALVDGLSNKEIGEKLFISISTVKTHIINIYSKLGVKNRVEAVNEGVKILKL